jgi:sarcosine oxidase subunit alpha
LINKELVVIGGGPAGMSAALMAAKQGAEVAIFDRGQKLGGQLVKQTHRFFGSEKEYAGTRGINISNILIDEIKKHEKIDIKNNSEVLAIYEDGVISYEEGTKYKKIKPEKVVIATGASEKMLQFTNNDTPGVYGAGAVQTLMNQHGVIPGEKVLMVGAGNIGLIVSYQLMQAGVKVEAIIDAAPRIGGYSVHASKVRRLGVPILTSHTITEALGSEKVTGAKICELNANWQPIQGTERKVDIDVICLAVGLSPLIELLMHVGCDMRFIPELSGNVPVKDENMETSVPGYFVAGDVSGVEEASSAMIEGKIAGTAAAGALGYDKNSKELLNEFKEELRILRSGEVGEKIRAGIKKLIS